MLAVKRFLRSMGMSASGSKQERFFSQNISLLCCERHYTGKMSQCHCLHRQEKKKTAHRVHLILIPFPASHLVFCLFFP